MRQQITTGYTNQAELVKAISANDEAALQWLYQQNYPKVLQFVLNNSGTAPQAQDIYQEAFIALWRNIRLNRFTPENETAVAGYLFRVAKNKWIDHLRSAQVKYEKPADEHLPEPVDELTEDKQHYIAEVLKELAGLGDNCREILERFYYLKQSLREIAAAMEWTEATARNNKYRCLQRLRDKLKQDH